MNCGRHLFFVVLSHHLKGDPGDSWLKVRLLRIHHDAHIQLCRNLATKDKEKKVNK
jgi:hypothetical protein